MKLDLQDIEIAWTKLESVFADTPRLTIRRGEFFASADIFGEMETGWGDTASKAVLSLLCKLGNIEIRIAKLREQAAKTLSESIALTREAEALELAQTKPATVPDSAMVPEGVNAK